MSHTHRRILSIVVWLFVIFAGGYWAEHGLRRVDECCYTAAGRVFGGWREGEYAQLHRGEEPVHNENVVLRRRVRQCPPVRYVDWRDNEQGEEQPLPMRQELATILHCMATKLGVRSVAVSTPLVWEDEQGKMSELMLQRAMAAFQHVGVGIAGRSAPQAQSTPEMLKDAIIPADHVRGDAAGLPSANMPQPYSLPLAPELPLAAAPDRLEDEVMIRDAGLTRGLSVPLLLRWNGEVMAALPLRLALAELGLSTADVQVRLGKSLRVGQLILPIDVHGRTPLGTARALPLAVEDVLAAYMPLPEAEQRCAALYRPQMGGGADRAARLAATLSVLLSREQEMLVPAVRPAGGHLFEQSLIHSSLTGRLAVVALMPALLLILLRLPSRRLHVSLLCLPVFLLALAWWLGARGSWVCLSSWGVGWALLALAALHLSHKPRPQEPTLW